MPPMTTGPGDAPKRELRQMTRPTCTATIGALLLAACATEQPPAGSPSTGPELVDAAIAYHDPNGQWPSFRHTLVIEQSRPDGSVRTADIRMDIRRGGYRYEEDTAGGLLVKGIDGQDCFATVGGQPPTAEQVEALRLDCPGIERMRDYYLYLWGLPMKLRDPGTNIDPDIGDGEFDGQPARVAKVTYDPEVGSDLWYFYFDANTYRMIGYRFHHDEAAGDGEYILLSGERQVLDMKIPVERRWFMNADDRYLGTDVLVDDFGGSPGG